MKISYSNYPILKAFFDGQFPNHLSFYDPDLVEVKKYVPFFFRVFKEIYYSVINKTTFYVSEPFLNAVELSTEKLRKVMTEMILGEDTFTNSGIYIIKDQVIAFYITNANEAKSYKTNILQFEKDGTILVAAQSVDNELKYWRSNNSKQQRLDKTIIKTDDTQSFLNLQFTINAITLFKKYAEVQTKILQPHSKKKDLNCKYINDTDLRICHLDSKWFTTLVKSDGFKVRGHFRLQPKIKDGKWTKELIWIDEFEKQGYTSKARKLSFISNETVEPV